MAARKSSKVNRKYKTRYRIENGAENERGLRWKGAAGPKTIHATTPMAQDGIHQLDGGSLDFDLTVPIQARFEAAEQWYWTG